MQLSAPHSISLLCACTHLKSRKSTGGCQNSQLLPKCDAPLSSPEGLREGSTKRGERRATIQPTCGLADGFAASTHTHEIHRGRRQPAIPLRPILIFSCPLASSCKADHKPVHAELFGFRCSGTRASLSAVEKTIGSGWLFDYML